MKCRKAAVMAAVLALTLPSAPAFAWHHVVAPVVAKTGGVPFGGTAGSKILICPTPAGIFICAIFVAGLIHEMNGPACASNSKYNVAHGYNFPRFWRPWCHNDQKPIRVRG